MSYRSRVLSYQGVDLSAQTFAYIQISPSVDLVTVIHISCLCSFIESIQTIFKKITVWKNKK